MLYIDFMTAQIQLNVTYWIVKKHNNQGFVFFTVIIFLVHWTIPVVKLKVTTFHVEI